MDLQRETRVLQGRPVLASNSVLIVASSAAPAVADLDTFAAHLVSHGCTIHSQTETAAALFRFETFAVPLLQAAQAAARRLQLAVSATMAVKVVVEGKPRPSPKSLDIGTALAREASPGNLVLSLRLASLLQATEPECAGLLRTTSVPSANGQRRAVVLFDASSAARPRAEVGVSQIAGTLPAELVERLIYRIHQRALNAAPGMSERDVRDAVLTSNSAASIANKLLRRVPTESQAALRLIVDDEVRWIRVRREASGAADA